MELKSSQHHHPNSSPGRWWWEETVAIVTGANKGIGYAVVKELAQSGITVLLTARDAVRGLKAVEHLRQTHGLLNVLFYRLDVSDFSSIESFVLLFQKHFGVLDILVNNAAVSFNEINENSVEHSETVIKTNYWGPKLLIQSLFPFFRRSPSIGRILNISSRLGSLNKMKNEEMKEMLEREDLTEEEIEGMIKEFIENVKNGKWKDKGWPEIWTDYSVSKMALNSYSRIIAKSFKNSGVYVNCFCPGFTQTSMTRGKGTHTPQDAAVFAARLALLPPQHLQTGIFYMGFTPGTLSKL